MGRGLLLWLIGIPIPIILLIWLFRRVARIGGELRDADLRLASAS